jgi:uncharacterized protein with PIN domain
MGCHTWYKKLVTDNQEEIIKKVKDAIAVSKHYDWYEVTSLKNLFESTEEWVQEIAEYVYGSIDGLTEVNGLFCIYEAANGYDTDEPRIGGYPNTIIKSSEEMFNAMQTGLTNWEGKHFNFYWEKSREEYIRNNIIEFFKAHPDGIIEFG